MLQHHPRRPLPDLSRVPLVCHGSILSRNGACKKLGEVQEYPQRRSKMSNHEALEGLAQLRNENANPQTQLNAIKNSLSWKSTILVRWIVGVVLKVIHWIGQLVLKLIGPHLDKYPNFTYKVIDFLAKFPHSHAVLSRALAKTRGMDHNALFQPGSYVVKEPGSRSVRFVWDKSPQESRASDRTIYVHVGHTLSWQGNTGIQRVTRRLSAAFMEIGEQVVFVKWDSVDQQCIPITSDEREHLAKWNGPSVFEGERHQRTGQSPIQGNSSVASGRNWLIVPEVPYMMGKESPTVLDLTRWARGTGTQTAFIFYDAIPLRLDLGESLRIIHSDYMENLLEADEVWAISDWARDDLFSYWLSHLCAPAESLPLLTTRKLAHDSHVRNESVIDSPQKNSILSVGSIEPRKNQLALVNAFCRFSEKQTNGNWTLDLVGRLNPQISNKFRRLISSKPNVKYHGPVSDEKLAKLYASCKFTVFPSLEEGFGLPIVESLFYGKPCITANFGVMADVAKSGGCVTINVRDETALENAISSLANDPSRIALLSSEASSIPQFTWRDYALSAVSRFNQASSTGRSIGLVYFFLDSTIRSKQNTGIQRVSRQTAVSLIASGCKLIPVTWDNTNNCLTAVSTKDLEFVSQWNGPTIEGWHSWVDPSHAPANSWFFETEVPTEHPMGFHLSLLNFAKSNSLRTALIFHDAIPSTLPDLYPSETTAQHREYMRQLLHYDLVFPISTHSANDLGDFLSSKSATHREIERIVKPIVLAGEFSDGQRSTYHTFRDGIAGHMLMVSSLEPGKNHKTLLAAFEIARKKLGGQLRLVLVGHSAYPDIVEHVERYVALYPEVSWDRNTDNSQLGILYSESDFTVYPSIAEGFGLPILESLWNGKPCICANVGSMNEIAQDGGCVTVDILDPEALATAIVQLATDTQLRSRLVHEAVNRKFKTWLEYGDEIIDQLCIDRRDRRQQNTEFDPNYLRTRLSDLNISAPLSTTL